MLSMSIYDTLLLLKGLMMDTLHAEAIGTVASFDVIINGYSWHGHFKCKFLGSIIIIL